MINRDLPRVDINGDTFIVDLNAGGLRNAEHPNNILRFADMTEPPDAVLKFPEMEEMPLKRFFYDSTRKEIATIPDGCEKLPTGICYMEVLTEKFLDPIYDLLQDGIDISDMPERHLKSWFHLAHEIPRVNLEERDFFVDTARQEIYQASDFSNKVGLDNVLFIEALEVVCFLMDSKGRLIDKPIETARMEDQLVLLPGIDQIDPIGFKRAAGEPAALLKQSAIPEKANRVVQQNVRINGRKI